MYAGVWICADILLTLTALLPVNCCWADTAYNQDGHLCGAHFSRALYKCLLDLPLHYNDFETDDPALWSGMVQFVLATDNIAEQSEAVVEGGLRFAEEVYSTSDPTRLLETVELQPNGQKTKKKTSLAQFLAIIAHYLQHLYSSPCLDLRLC